MPRNKEYENRIPAFYRKNTLDIMLFVHVTAMIERNKMEIKDAVNDFFSLYGIDEDELPLATAIKVYHRVRVNFLWMSLKDHLNNSKK